MLRFQLTVFDYQTALLYRDGLLVERLGAGRHRFWTFFGRTYNAVVFDLRPTTLNLQGQEILTKDKIPLRLNLVCTYRVVDPEMAQMQSDNWLQRLYIDVQLALRDLVGGLTFDEVLDKKTGLGEQALGWVVPLTSQYGVEVQRVAVKDLTMPANIRDVMLKVLEAEKSAQATLIKTREEVAAARARANAAKLLTEVPGALRLKELDTLAEMSKNPGTKIVWKSGPQDAKP